MQVQRKPEQQERQDGSALAEASSASCAVPWEVRKLRVQPEQQDEQAPPEQQDEQEQPVPEVQ